MSDATSATGFGNPQTENALVILELEGEIERLEELLRMTEEACKTWEDAYHGASRQIDDAERQRARLPDDLVERLRAAHDDPDGRCNRQWRILSGDILAWHDRQEARNE